MRHAEIATTMKYYVTMDADAVADEVWGRKWEASNTFGNNSPESALESENQAISNLIRSHIAMLERS